MLIKYPRFFPIFSKNIDVTLFFFFSGGTKRKHNEVNDDPLLAKIRPLIYNPPGLRVPIRQTFRTDTVSALCIPALKIILQLIPI